MTLEEVFQFIEANEAGKRSAGHLLQTQGADAARSQYYHAKQDELKTCTTGNKNNPCNYCGKRGHGKNAPTGVRKSKCPANGAICEHCGRANHFETIRRSKNKPKN